MKSNISGPNSSADSTKNLTIRVVTVATATPIETARFQFPNYPSICLRKGTGPLWLLATCSGLASNCVLLSRFLMGERNELFTDKSLRLELMSIALAD